MFRFTIRDVLWLTVVVSIGVSWWVDNKRIEKMIARLEKEGRLLREAQADELTVLREYRIEQAKAASKLTPPIFVPGLNSSWGPPRPVNPRARTANDAAEPNP